MTFTPPEHQAILARAHEAIERRDRRHAMRQRAGLTAVLLLATTAALILWWPRSPASVVMPIAESRNTSPAAPAMPPWLEIIDSDDEIEAGFAEAGECARVVRVDHKVLTVACADLEVLPRSVTK